MGSLSKKIDTLLPQSARENTSLNLEELIRSRVLISILFCSVAATVLALILFSILQFVTENDFTNPLIIAGTCFVVVMLIYLFYIKTGKLDATGMLYSLCFFIAVIVSVVLTGGYSSPVKQILVCSPVLAFLIGGRQEGLYNGVLVFVAGVILILLDATGFELLQIMPVEILPYLSASIWFITVLMLVICLYVYDLLLEDKRGMRPD